VNDARNRRSVLAPDDEHVASIAVGDDLLLEIFRGVLAAQVRFQGAAQPRLLLAQTLANAAQLGAGIVDDVPGRVDLAADVGDLLFERGGGIRDAAQDWKRGAGAADRADDRIDRGKERCQREQLDWLDRPPFDGKRGENRIQIVGRLETDAVLPEKSNGLRGPSQRCADGTWIRVRFQTRELLPARRRLGIPAHRLHDPVEFEGPQGALVHESRSYQLSAVSLQLLATNGHDCRQTFSAGTAS
jgi:hypothetical protein